MHTSHSSVKISSMVKKKKSPNSHIFTCVWGSPLAKFISVFNLIFYNADTMQEKSATGNLFSQLYNTLTTETYFSLLDYSGSGII